MLEAVRCDRAVEVGGTLRSQIGGEPGLDHAGSRIARQDDQVLVLWATRPGHSSDPLQEEPHAAVQM